MSKLHEHALAALARREHSAAELKRKLQKHASPEAVAEEVALLQQAGLQSDARFVESYIRRRAQAGFGPQRIAVELKSRGVSEACFSEALTASLDWAVCLRQVIQKKYPTLSEITKNAPVFARCVRFLTGRGFAWHMIREALQTEHGDAIEM